MGREAKRNIERKIGGIKKIGRTDNIDNKQVKQIIDRNIGRIDNIDNKQVKQI